MAHWYNRETGECSEVAIEGWLPSVTTILKATESYTARQTLANHYIKGQFAAHSANAAACERGQYVDRWIKAYLTKSALPSLNYIYQPWCDQVRPHLDLLRSGEIVLISKPVYGDGYAGEPDLIVNLPTTGLTLVEFKTRDAPPGELMLRSAHLQAAAYAQAYEFQYGRSIDQVQLVVIQSNFMQVHRSVPAWYLPEWDTRKEGYVSAQTWC